MVKQFTSRPGYWPLPRFCIHTVTARARAPARRWLASIFAVLVGLGQAVQAAGGDPDLEFDGDGRVITDLSNAQRADTANDLAIQFDDKIVVVGMVVQDDAENVAVLRYHPGGSLDGGFGQQGVVIRDFLPGQHDRAEGVVLQRDGKILVVGAAGDPPGGPPNRRGTRDFLVARFHLNGDPDLAFGGGDGVVTTGFGPGSDDFATAVVLQPDGRIVAAGNSVSVLAGTVVDGSQVFALARYNTDGSLDDGGPADTTPGDRFGSNGLVSTDFAAGDDRAVALALAADGRIVAAGCAGGCGGAPSDFAIARYLSDGQPDPSFDGDGRVITDFLHGGFNDIARGVAIQADGRIVAGGSAARTASGNDVFAVARYLADGSLDASFGGDGRVTTEFRLVPGDDLSADLANSLIVQPDGMIVAAGRANLGGFFDPAALALAQYRPDGSLDGGFGSGGTVLTCLNPAGLDAPCDLGMGTLTRARAVVLQRDGKPVVAGFFAGEAEENSRAFDFLVARYDKAIVDSEVRRCQGEIPTVFGSPEQTTLRGTPGRDVILGSSAGELIIGGAGRDIICGEEGDDLIFGEGGRDRIEGGAGNDQLDGGGKNDRLRGGPGSDLLVGGSGDDGMDGGPGEDRLIGGAANDRMRGGEDDDVLVGGAGDDELRGNAGDDELLGDSRKSGGKGGDDTLIGGPGRDTMFGGPGSDIMRGGGQGDSMVGGRGADHADGGSGSDLCFLSESRVSCKEPDGTPRPEPPSLPIPSPCNFPGCGE